MIILIQVKIEVVGVRASYGNKCDIRTARKIGCVDRRGGLGGEWENNKASTVLKSESCYFTATPGHWIGKMQWFGR